MKRTILLCTLSAVIGGWVSRGHRELTTHVAAQGTQQPMLREANRAHRSDLRFGTAEHQSELDGLTEEERVNIRVYDRSNRSVVNITTEIVRADQFLFFALPGQGTGSGSVVDKNGHILTNHHVIKDARTAQVTLYNGESYPAQLVGQDPVNDIAVLNIDAPPDMLYPVAQGQSGRLRVGQKVYAIGNPFGLERTMTVGIISSLNRTLDLPTGRKMKSIIQIDAALNRGNSGGPLLDSQGRLIGMNTAIANPSGTGENTGIGFAIPVATLRRVVPELTRHGRMIRPDAGIARVYETEHGLVVAKVVSNGPADRAGVRGFGIVREQTRRGALLIQRTYRDPAKADVIVGVAGQAIRTADEFLTAVERHKPGDRVILRVIREGRELQVPIVLGVGE